MHFKKGQTVSIFFADKLTTSPMQGPDLSVQLKSLAILLTAQYSTVKILQTVNLLP